jgi:hypothetical protein
MFVPENEQGVIAVFFMGVGRSRWSVCHVGTTFPDVILELENKKWRVEFEFNASNFIKHKHDPRSCDLIICWNNDIGEYTIPVIELRDPNWVNQEPRKTTEVDKEIALLRSQIEELTNKNLKLMELCKLVGEGTETRKYVDQFNFDEQFLQDIKTNGWSPKRLQETFGIGRTTVYNHRDRLEALGRLSVNGDVKVVNA